MIKKFYAIFIIQVFLVSVMAHVVFSAELTNIRVYSDENIDGVVKYGSAITISATVTGMAQNEVVMINGYLPMSCSSNSCSYILEKPVVNEGENSLGLGSFDTRTGASMAGSTVTKLYVVDKSAPMIINPSSSSSLGLKDNVTVNAVIEDKKFGRCMSGIATVVISIGKKSFNYAPNGNCSFNLKFSVPISSITSKSESLPVTITATDRFGFSKSIGLPVVTLDATSPVLNMDSFKVIVIDHADGEYLGKEIYPIKFMIDVNSPDLSKINAEYFDDLVNKTLNKTGICSPVYNGFHCEWNSNIRSFKSGKKAYNFKLTAIDSNLNSISETFKKDFMFDLDPPSADEIYTNYGEFEKKIVFGKITNVTVKINKDKSGFSKENLYLNLSQINPTLSSMKTAGCVKSECSFRYVNATTNDGLKIITISSDSKDDAGNTFKRLNATAILDTKAPQLVTISVESTNTKKEYEGIIKVGDKIDVTARVKEDHAVAYAIANFSSIYLNESKKSYKETKCKAVKDLNGIFECKFTSDEINLAGYSVSPVYITFVDIAGNKLVHREDVTILGVLNGSQRFWSATADCSPSMIDRQTAELVKSGHKVYCHVKLSPFGITSGTTLSMKLKNCEEMGDKSLSKKTLINAYKGSLDPYLFLTLQKKVYDFDFVSATCTIEALSRVKIGIAEYVNKDPEQIPVQIGLTFYNTPVGEITEEVQAKIDEVVEKWVRGYGKWIDILNMLRKFAETVCKAKSTMTTLAAAMGSVKNPVTQAASEVVDSKSDSFTFDMGKFCEYVTCKNSKDTLNAFPTASIIKDYTGLSADKYMNPKDSFIVSLVTICIPGIIYNLEKYRQIQCLYGYCLQEGVPRGVTLESCDAIKAYSECRYLWTGLFKAIPFAAFIDYVTNGIKEVLSNPLSMIGAVIGAVCAPNVLTSLDNIKDPDVVSGLQEKISNLGLVQQGDNNYYTRKGYSGKYYVQQDGSIYYTGDAPGKNGKLPKNANSAATLSKDAPWDEQTKEYGTWSGDGTDRKWNNAWDGKGDNVKPSDPTVRLREATPESTMCKIAKAIQALGDVKDILSEFNTKDDVCKKLKESKDQADRAKEQDAATKATASNIEKTVDKLEQGKVNINVPS